MLFFSIYNCKYQNIPFKKKFNLILKKVVITPHFYSVWSGPYGVIFSCLVLYILDVPSTETYKVWKFNLSEKYAIYLLSIQLSIAHFPNSTIAAISGILAGKKEIFSLLLKKLIFD